MSSSRALMLPSLLATYPRAYRRRPASTMSARICSSARVLIIRSNLQDHEPRRRGGSESSFQENAPCLRASAVRDRYSSRHFSEQKYCLPSEIAESGDT